jgi:hypothetical protein
MATYVLVHGEAHGGWCYGPVARILRSAGRRPIPGSASSSRSGSPNQVALWAIPQSHLMNTEPEAVAALLLKGATA